MTPRWSRPCRYRAPQRPRMRSASDLSLTFYGSWLRDTPPKATVEAAEATSAAEAVLVAQTTPPYSGTTLPQGTSAAAEAAAPGQAAPSQAPPVPSAACVASEPLVGTRDSPAARPPQGIAVGAAVAADAGASFAGEPTPGPVASAAAPVQEAGVPKGGRYRPIVAISPRVVALVQDTCASVMLSQLIYWSRVGHDVVAREGWIHKTSAEWQRETGLSWKMQRRARRLLLEQGWIEERLRSMPATLEFRLRLTTLLPALARRCDVEVGADWDWGFVAQPHNAAMAQLMGRSFVYDCRLSHCLSVPATMLASRLLQAVGRSAELKTHSGWKPAWHHYVRMSRSAWRTETGLTRDQWQTARRDLAAAGLLVERHGNFPRRVDLAIDVPAVQALFARLQSGDRSAAESPTARVRPEAGLDWAKQQGGIGRCPKRPTRSPRPTDCDRPDPPAPIAQTCLQPLGGLHLGLQPPPQGAHAGAAASIGMTMRWSAHWGGGWVGTGDWRKATDHLARRAPAQAQAGHGRSEAEAALEEAAPQAVSELVWPKLFTTGDRRAAMAHLAALDPTTQQLVLDEIDWQHSCKPVRSPVALVRTLVRKAADGAFEPDGAHRISSARGRLLRARDGQDDARRDTASTLRRQDPQGLQASTSGETPDQARARLRALRERLVLGRRFA